MPVTCFCWATFRDERDWADHAVSAHPEHRQPSTARDWRSFWLVVFDQAALVAAAFFRAFVPWVR